MILYDPCPKTLAKPLSGKITRRESKGKIETFLVKKRNIRRLEFDLIGTLRGSSLAHLLDMAEEDASSVIMSSIVIGIAAGLEEDMAGAAVSIFHELDHAENGVSQHSFPPP